MKFFKGSVVFSIFGLIASLFVGFYYSQSWVSAGQALFICAVLAILEISLSFDNAIVNAIVLKKMTPVWRRRFLTWGMLIAVFGMRLIFPLLIVTVMANVTPWEALILAATKPDDYAKIMLASHLQVSAFGSCFLLMVALKYFYDQNKKNHWFPIIEQPAALLGKVEAIEIGITLGLLLIVKSYLPEEQKLSFILAGLAGLITFLIVDGLSSWLEATEETVTSVHKASAGMFLYLEVLDASFSFDGVVGAFAITHNLFIIMIGLSIGAFFVRSLTIYFVEKETLKQFVFLENGAFYAIAALAMIMMLDPFLHIPEWITGIIGAVFIVGSFIASNRAQARVDS